MKIGIIGNGFVGKATKLLSGTNIEILMYDIKPELCIPFNLTLETMCSECSIIFISVPTPMKSNGECHTAILESVVKNISEYCDLNKKLIVNRCTVPVGKSDDLNCFFMPEFLTEKNFEEDFVSNKNWIMGLKNDKTHYLQNKLFKQEITNLINIAYKNKSIQFDNIDFVSNSEAESIKLFRNCFLATKVSFCNEFYQFCEKRNVNYENVRKLATLDSRIGDSHSKVPGHDGHFGFGGTCFPKDMNNFNYQLANNNIQSFIIKGALDRNYIIDRPEQDWNQDSGRAVVNE